MGSGAHADMLDWYRRLIALRRSTADLQNPRMDGIAVTFDEAAGLIVIRRGSVTIAANLGPESREVDNLEEAAKSADVVLASPGDLSTGPAGTIRLPPDSVAIVVRRSGI